MIIDCHCHAGSGDRMSGPWDTRADLTHYLRRCDDVGIGHSVVFAALATDYRRGNDEVAALVRAYPGRLTGFVFLDGRMTFEVVRGELEKHVVGNGFAGIKCHRHDAPLSRTICEHAQRMSLPVLYDVGGDVASIELFATEYPGVNFIVPHLGSFADDWKAQLAIIDHLQRHPNVYTDTAGCRRFDLLLQAVRRAGAHKVLFGSDGPWLHPGVELEKIRQMRLSERAFSLVAGGNLLRLLGARATNLLRATVTTRWRGSSAGLFSAEWLVQ